MDKIIGHWENNEIDYHFYLDNTFKIIWKIKKENSIGKYNLIGNDIFLEYGTNYLMKWNGTIEVLNDSSLHIKDESNEIGKVDEFKRNIPKTNIFDKDIIYKTKIQYENARDYPQILFPKSITSLLEKEKFQRPVKPDKIYRPIEENNNIFKFGLMIGGVLMLLLFANSKIFFLANVGSIIALIGFIWLATYPEGRKLDKETKVYLEKYKSYEIQLKKYNKQISIPENEYDNFIKGELLLNKFGDFDDVLYN